MVPKRPFSEGEEDDYEAVNHEAQQRIATNFARNVMHGISSQELALTLEPLIRGWVRDEVQRACCSSPRSPFNAPEPCATTSLQLRFQTKLPQMLFTGSRVESEDNGSVKIVLLDTNLNKIVSSGPLSSLKVHIVPLDGDFSVDDDEVWSQKDFEAKVIHARDGKRPLVTGELVVLLKDGVGDLGEVYFTDNSSWRRSRKFRLGAQANGGVRIREARSEAFVVKDHRGESYKKHHPPSLEDEIWRLDKIAKDGAFHKRLELNKIYKVKDFLQIFVTNEPSLRKSFVESLKLQFYHNLDGMLPMDDLAVFGASMLTSNSPGDPLRSGAGLVHPDVNIPSIHPEQPQMQLELTSEGSSMQFFSPALRNSFVLKDFYNGPYGEGCSLGPGMLSGQQAADFDFQVGPSLWQGNEVFCDPCNQTVNTVSSDANCFSRNGSPRGRWCKIRAVVKWASVMRDVAAKRMAELYPYLDFSA